MKQLKAQLWIIVALVGVASAQTWVQLAPTGVPPAAWSAANYDVTNNRLIAYFQGNPAVNASTSNQVWVLTNANGIGGTPVWSQLSPTGTPPVSNALGTAAYDAARNRLIIYGGCYANCSPALSDVFVLTNANGLGGTPVWSQSSVSNPEARDGQTAIYDSVTNVMVTFGGGLAFYGTDQNDTRILSNANGVPSPSSWNSLSLAGPLPGIRETQTAVYDQANDRMTLFAGTDLITTCCPYAQSDYNDTWVLSHATGIGGTPGWTQLTPSGTLPGVRSLHSAVYDSANNRMIVFGGLVWNQAAQNYTVLGDLWQLTNANGLGGPPAWSQLAPTGTSPGPRALHNAVFDSANQRMIVLDGLGYPGGISTGVWVLAMGPVGPLYNICLLYDPTKAVHSGATVPIKLQLCDGSGNDLSSSSINVHATSVTQTSTSISGTVQDSGTSNPDGDFRFDSTLGTTGGYVFNLKTNGLTTGTYNLNFTVTGDSFVYATPFQVK